MSYFRRSSYSGSAVLDKSLGFWRRSVKGLAPGYFASVMATGIVSVALWLVNWRMWSIGFWIVASAMYLVLIVAYGLRLFLEPRAFAQDLMNPVVFFGFFTFVAGSGVLGSRFIIGGIPGVGVGLGAVATLAWLVLSYWAGYRLLDGNSEPASRVVNGTWLLFIVGAQALTVTATLLVPTYPQSAVPLLFFAFCFWGVGVIFYLAVIFAVMGRLFFSPIHPAETTPPYWINMGAVAITTLAGAHLVLATPHMVFLTNVRAFIEGFTVVLWAFGSWWIPLLLIVGWWRHIRGGVSFRYDPAFWSMVFPLGMYTAATATLSLLPGLRFIHAVVPWGLGAALIAWTFTAVGYLIHSGRWLREPGAVK